MPSKKNMYIDLDNIIIYINHLVVLIKKLIDNIYYLLK